MDFFTIESFAQFGLSGLILGVLVYVLYSNSKERRDMAGRHENTVKGVVSVVRENNEVVANNSKVLEGLKEVVRSLRK